MSEITSTALDVRRLLDNAQRDMLNTLYDLAEALPAGFAVSCVDVDTLVADTVGGKRSRLFTVAINIEVRG